MTCYEILSLIIGAVGAIATFSAVIVALWQTKFANMKKLKLSFSSGIATLIGDIYYPDREKTQLTDAIKAVSDIFRKYRYISDYSVVVEYRFVKNLSDFLFWCEQKLCGKIQMTCLGTLTDESEIEKIDKKLSDTFISQIIDAEKNAKK